MHLRSIFTMLTVLSVQWWLPPFLQSKEMLICTHVKKSSHVSCGYVFWKQKPRFTISGNFWLFIPVENTMPTTGEIQVSFAVDVVLCKWAIFGLTGPNALPLWVPKISNNLYLLSPFESNFRRRMVSDDLLSISSSCNLVFLSRMWFNLDWSEG